MAEPRYTTVADVQARGVTDTEANILAAILRAEEWIDLITRRFFVPTELAFDQDGTGHESLRTEYYPIQELTEVTFEYGLWGPTHTVVLGSISSSSTDVIVKKEEGVLINRRQVWPSGEDNVHITGTFGEAECPLLIKEAATVLAMAGGAPQATALVGSPISAINLTMASETIGAYSYSRKATNYDPNQSTGIPTVDTILHQFKREPFLKAVGQYMNMSDDSVLRRVVGEY